MGRLTMFKEKTAKILVAETSLSARSVKSLESLEYCVMNAMASPPKFKQRGAIERSDGMGLERISVEKQNKSAS